MTRALDRQVAEQVFGEQPPVYAHEAGHIDPVWMGNWFCCPSYDEGDKCEWAPRHFSTSIADAFLVVERMRERGYKQVRLITQTKGRWYVEFKYPNNEAVWRESDTLPEAICLAALAAVQEGRG